jgi:3-hydroxyacyl-CoA dehydrogenase
MESGNKYSSWLRAQRVCVIGAGTMGSGIAAHLANLGFEVSLLDVSQESVHQAFDRARSARPPHFYVPDRANDVRLGSIAENLDWVSDADWVCEAIVERLEAKRDLFAAIDPILRPDAMISTNTSGLQIGLLAEGRSNSFRERFVGTHFFNPPRYLKLLELIPTEDTDPEAVEAMTAFLEERAARRVVLAKDTPGFIANRYGMWAMFHAVHTAEKLHLSVEDVDAITGPFLGRPRSGSFRLNDLVGLDVMRDIAQNLIDRCPDDPHLGALRTPASMHSLLARGWIGEKAGQGYYRKEGRELLALDLQTFTYRQRREPGLPTLERLGREPFGDRLREALDGRDEVGEFLREYLVPALRYADYLKEEISHNVRDFDRVMKWGFGWEKGPFETIDAIGGERLGIEGEPYYRDGKVRQFAGGYFEPAAEPQYRTVQEYEIISKGDTYNLRDLGDGVSAICITTKMGVITPTLVAELTTLLESKPLDTFVLTSEARSFSAGYDLKYFASAIEDERWTDIDIALQSLHHLGELLEGVRSVAAVYGHCLGAGFELAASCSRIVANAETQIGLPEAKVGLIPGGRGTVLMRLNNQRTARRLAEVAMTVTLGAVSNGADHARLLGYLRPTDSVVYHPDRLLAEAKRTALETEPTQREEWITPEGPIIGMIDRSQDEVKARGEMSDHDELIGDKIKSVFAKTGSYEQALERERKEFIDLCQRALTIARIRHMLETGKPMRN